jgi:hypothetical protein
LRETTRHVEAREQIVHRFNAFIEQFLAGLSASDRKKALAQLNGYQTFSRESFKRDYGKFWTSENIPDGFFDRHTRQIFVLDEVVGTFGALRMLIQELDHSVTSAPTMRELELRGWTKHLSFLKQLMETATLRESVGLMLAEEMGLPEGVGQAIAVFFKNVVVTLNFSGDRLLTSLRPTISDRENALLIEHAREIQAFVEHNEYGKIVEELFAARAMEPLAAAQFSLTHGWSAYGYQQRFQEIEIERARTMVGLKPSHAPQPEVARRIVAVTGFGAMIYFLLRYLF